MSHASLLIAAASYLLGSVPSGYLLIRIFRHQDIRSVGSGNIGATNVLRSGGKGLGLATFLIDMLKGSSAVLLGGWLGSIFATSTLQPREAQAIAAVFAVIGHVFTVWLRFKGGKGVATGFGVFLVASPWAALAAISIFAVVLVLSRYVSLASILGALSFPILAWLFARLLNSGPMPPLFIAAQFFVAALIVIKHHQNIGRLIAGTESRLGAKKTA
ncbi:MAG: glycerol-3-phosphate 1-O-acyltransferase PlsY [Terracidiphilus sp.]|nr:glycerol-3-phosphate 1-O-acyltransferase PlsY [Terracidiphilus sp.]